MSNPYDAGINDAYSLVCTDRLGVLLAADPDTTGRYQGAILGYPLNVAQQLDGNGIALPPAISIYSPIDSALAAKTMGPSGLGRFQHEFTVCLELALNCPQQISPADTTALYRRLKNYTNLFQKTLFKYRAVNDLSNPNVQLWHMLAFQNPATVVDRVPGSLMLTITKFTLSALRGVP